MTKTQIYKRDGGYTRFRQVEHKEYFEQKWKETTLDVRRVRQTDRNETQIEVSIEKCVSKKALRVYSQLSSFVLTPSDARQLALAICPELAEEQEESFGPQWVASKVEESERGFGRKS